MKGIEKVIENGLVAVCYSPGFGAGWSTWCDTDGINEVLIFHPKIVEMVREERCREIDEDWMAENFGEKFRDVYCDGAGNLDIEWLPEGTIFRIEEYDGAESVVVISDKTAYKA